MYCVFDRISRRYLSWRLNHYTPHHFPTWVESVELANVWADERQARRSAAECMQLDPNLPDAYVLLLSPTDVEPVLLSWERGQS